MGRRHSDLRFHHTVCVGCRLILCHNPSITPALGADDAFPRMCMLHKSRCLWLFFRVRRLSDLINPIRCSHTPFSQLLFSPVPIQLFWGLFHSSGNNIRSTLPKTLSSTIHLTRSLLSGGWGGFHKTVLWDYPSEKWPLYPDNTNVAFPGPFRKRNFYALRRCPAASFYFSWSILRSSSGSLGLRQLSLSITSQH